MNRFEDLKKVAAETLEKVIKNYEEKAVNYAAELVYEVTNKKVIQVVDHSLGDNPYDHSGVLVSVENNIDINTYGLDEGDWIERNVEHYLGEFCNGNATATYCSGCGLMYGTYYDYFKSFVSEDLSPIVSKEIFEELYKNHHYLLTSYEDASDMNKEELLEFWDTEICFEVECFDFFIETELISLIEKRDLIELYSIGKKFTDEI